MSTERNLLFGVLALQLELIDPNQFADACSALAARNDKSLAEILVERSWLTSEDKADVERLLERKLERHGGDVHSALYVAAHGTAHEALSRTSDPLVSQTLNALAVTEEYVAMRLLVQRGEEKNRYSLTRLKKSLDFKRFF